MINRRDFLKCSVLSLPAVPLFGNASSGDGSQGAPTGGSMATDISTKAQNAIEASKISIVSVVDTVGALSDKTLLRGNLCMMDNSPWSSTGQGTPALCTLCKPGQLINWVIYALDLQTPVEIRNIIFIDAKSGSEAQQHPAESDKLHLRVWSGVVPANMVRGVEYRYRFELQINEGKSSVMFVDTPSLKWL